MVTWMPSLRRTFLLSSVVSEQWRPATFEITELLHSICCILIFHGCRLPEPSKISFEARIAAAQMIDFQALDYFTYSGSISLVSLAIWANFLIALINTAAVGPQRVQRPFTGYDSTVWQFQG